jgi:hypothetical protein
MNEVQQRKCKAVNRGLNDWVIRIFVGAASNAP